MPRIELWAFNMRSSIELWSSLLWSCLLPSQPIGPASSVMSTLIGSSSLAKVFSSTSCYLGGQKEPETACKAMCSSTSSDRGIWSCLTPSELSQCCQQLASVPGQDLSHQRLPENLKLQIPGTQPSACKYELLSVSYHPHPLILFVEQHLGT